MAVSHVRAAAAATLMAAGAVHAAPALSGAVPWVGRALGVRYQLRGDGDGESGDGDGESGGGGDESRRDRHDTGCDRGLGDGLGLGLGDGGGGGGGGGNDPGHSGHPRGLVALTFDDGPHPAGTPAVLDMLRLYGVPATFFLVGEQVERDPGLAAEIVAAGHDVALHCHRHRNLLRLTPGQVAEDLHRAHTAIVAATDRAPRLYRPPYGVLTAAALREARRNEWRVVLWSRWGRDWRRDATPHSVAEEVATGLHGDDVLLLHDADHYATAGSWRATVGALPRIIDAAHDAGLRFVAAGDAL